MPYITLREREALDEGRAPRTAGELNYCVTKMVDTWIHSQERGLCYRSINEAIGVLECAKLELYRRVAAQYEDGKIIENGDVYRCQTRLT